MFFYVLFLGDHRAELSIRHVFRGVVCARMCVPKGLTAGPWRGDSAITASPPRSLCLSYVSF